MFRAITDHLVREVHQDLMDAMELRYSLSCRLFYKCYSCQENM